MPPRISVLLPTFRYGRFLSEAVESVLEQDEPDFELLIADDASDDGTSDLVRAWGRHDPRIRTWVHSRNLGMVTNWNFLLRHAQGTYVKYVFGDDRLESPRALRTFADRLDANPDAALASTARVLLDEHSARQGVWNDLGARTHWDGEALIARCLDAERNLIGEPTAVMFRRAAAQRGFDPALRQLVDLELWLHLLRGGGLRHEPEPLVAFRQHAGQASAANAHGHAASVDFLIILSRYHEHFVGSDGPQPHTWPYRRRLFRQIYYARKEKHRSTECARAEADLRGRLGWAGYWSCWAQHRITKPFVNLKRRVS